MKYVVSLLAVALMAAVAKADAPFSPNGFTFLNVVAYAPGKEDVAAADMREYAARTGNDIVLYCLTLHPEGKPAFAKVEEAVASYRRFAAALKGSAVRPGILLQAIVGHWPRVDEEIEPWQRTVDIDGREVRFCIFDPSYRDYVFRVGAALAKERPALILGDDDIRAFSPQAECFCPLHTAEFNRRTGRDLTPDAFRELIRGATLESDEHRTFVRLQQDTVNAVCKAIRDGVDSVDPSISCGVSIPGWVWSTAGAAEMARIMAGGGCRFARLPNGQYSESSVRDDLPGAVLFGQAMKAWYGEEIGFLLDESDTYPHNLWSKSAAAMHAKLVTSALTGVKGAKAWLVNSRKYGYPVSRHYTDVLAKHRGYYAALSRLESETVPGGVLTPCHRRFPVQTVGEVKYGKERLRPQDRDGWAECVFGKFGVPFAATFDLTQDGVYAVAGASAIGRFSDAELDALFSRKVLVDGAAARAVAERGRADLLGVSVADAPLAFTGERDESLGHDMSFPSTYKVPNFTPSADSEVLSWLIRRPKSGAEDYCRVAPGAVLSRNAKGGTVLVTAYDTGLGVTHLYGVSRQRWLWHLLDAISGAPFDNLAVEPQNQLVLLRRAADGAESAMVMNLNPDPLEAVRLRRVRRPSSVERLAEDGTWQTVDSTWDGGVLTVSCALPCYGECVIRCR